MHSHQLLPFRTLGHLLASQNQFYVTVIMMKTIKRSLLLGDQRLSEDFVQMHRETHPKIVHRINKDTEVPVDMRGKETTKEAIK